MQEAVHWHTGIKL